MLGINSNINSLVAQQNLTGSGSALSQAITRLSSGKRINSAADDAAGLAISNIMQTQINGLNQGVSNSNDGVSMVQTASSGLSSLTSSLQRIRQLATQASNGSMTSSDRAALQQEVSQQIQEVNRIASQTTYNGMNVLNGSLGTVSFQVGANVGQTITLNLSQNMSASSLGTGAPQAGQTLGTYTGLALNTDGTKAVAGTATASITGASSTNASSITVTGGVGAATFKDNNGTYYAQDTTGAWYSGANAAAATTKAAAAVAGTGLGTTADAGTIAALNQAAQSVTTTAGTATVAINAANNTGTGATPAGTTSVTATDNGKGTQTYVDNQGNTYTDNAGTWKVSVNGGAATALDAVKDAGTITALNAASTTATANVTSTVTTPAAITSINVLSDGKGGFTFTDQNNQALATNTVSSLFGANTAQGQLATGGLDAVANATTDATVTSQINALNKPSTVANIDISTAQGASMAMESIDNALSDVNNLQATLGAAQNRFTAIASTQQAQSTDLSNAQSNITDANFASETANLSKAQVLQQAGISVLAQANSQPQQILKLLQ
ncbi:flagellin [Paraburkholderia silviterrae]|uniref:Flagellin n=1 Tax=Paraburkholderia silviterrae TaxID=2528715 RepID=A0A4R5MAZ8_9BURK|nr:flagellin [Paraburkholderia silviterrae]TDG23944.1 flagellin [Paraburkholderia silviterrae]